jgi:hypothetical protein
VFISEDKMVNEELYIDILRHVRDARNKTTKMQNQELVSTSRQCSSTPVGFGQEFLSE